MKILFVLAVGLFSFIIIKNFTDDFPSNLETNKSPRTKNTGWFPFVSTYKKDSIPNFSSKRSGFNKRNHEFNVADRLSRDDQDKMRLEMIQGDIEKINKGPDENFGEFASSLMRLSTQRNPSARDKALELMKSKDKRLSLIAFRALGYYDEDMVNKELGKLLKSKESEVKRNAVFALAWNPKSGSGRKMILDEFVNSSKTSDSNSMIAMGSLYRMTSDVNEKSGYFKKILDIAQDSKVPGEKFLATRTLMQMDPKNSVAKELMAKHEKEFKSSRDSVRRR